MHHLIITVGFWCQTIHKKFLQRFDTIFGLKMMMKSGLEKIILKFHDGLQSCCCPVQKNLPRKAELAWQVSRYLWRPPWNFKIIFSRPLFTIILSQNWCQISVRIFCVLPGTKNLQWYSCKFLSTFGRAFSELKNYFFDWHVETLHWHMHTIIKSNFLANEENFLSNWIVVLVWKICIKHSIMKVIVILPH